MNAEIAIYSGIHSYCTRRIGRVVNYAIGKLSCGILIIHIKYIILASFLFYS